MPGAETPVKRFNNESAFVPLEHLTRGESVTFQLGHVAGEAILLMPSVDDHGVLVGASVMHSGTDTREKNPDGTLKGYQFMPFPDQGGQPVYIGRESEMYDMHVKIPNTPKNDKVSRNHARVRWGDTTKGFGLILDDVSANGTYTTNEKVHRLGETAHEVERWSKTRFGVGQVAKKHCVENGGMRCVAGKLVMTASLPYQNAACLRYVMVLAATTMERAQAS